MLHGGKNGIGKERSLTTRIRWGRSRTSNLHLPNWSNNASKVESESFVTSTEDDLAVGSLTLRSRLTQSLVNLPFLIQIEKGELTTVSSSIDRDWSSSTFEEQTLRLIRNRGIRISRVRNSETVHSDRRRRRFVESELRVCSSDSEEHGASLISTVAVPTKGSARIPLTSEEEARLTFRRILQSLHDRFLTFLLPPARPTAYQSVSDD